jgi:uncharacterized protein
MKALVEYIAKALVDHPDDVQVQEIENRSSIIIELRVAPDDMGRIIGKSGRVANAIRTLLRSQNNAEDSHKRISLDIL